MIRARATVDGKPAIVLGVSRVNITRLVDRNEPISVTGESIGMPDLHSIVIYFAETEPDLLRTLRRYGAIRATTAIHVDRKPEHTS